MRAVRLQEALGRLTTAIRDVESELLAMKAEHDPLATHIFISRRHYRGLNDTKSGKRREMLLWLWYTDKQQFPDYIEPLLRVAWSKRNMIDDFSKCV